MEPVYFVLPGLNNSGEAHWQTLWEQQYGFTRIQQRDWDELVRTEWVDGIDAEVMKQDPRKVILIAHSLACCTVAYWAATYHRVIRGALLVGPSDTEAATYPAGTTGFMPMPLQHLPFPSLVVASSNDYYVSAARARFFASCWGSRFYDVGPRGHINSSSNLGSWTEGYELLQTL